MKIDPIPAIKIDPILDYKQSSSNRRASNGNKIRKYLKYGLIVLAVFVFLKFDAISDYYTVQTFEGDYQLVNLADQAGLNLNGKALFLSKSPELVTANRLYEYCPRNEGALGCYVPSEDKIYILEITTPPYSQSIPSTIAHEMLHVAWEELSSDQRAQLTSAIKKHMNESVDAPTQSIKKILTTYEDKEAIQIGESHSFIGSELSEAATDHMLDEHYRSYFSDRDKSAEANATYVADVENLKNGLDARVAALETRLGELQDYETKWLRSFDSAFAQDAYYGNYRSYNSNVERYNGNLQTYNGLVDEYEKERASLNASIDTYNNAMKAMRPDKLIDTVKTTAE